MVIPEIRKVTEKDIIHFNTKGSIITEGVTVKISESDFISGSPKLGDVIASDPNNKSKQWLITEESYNKNFK